MEFKSDEHADMDNLVAATIGVFVIVIVLIVTAFIGAELENSIDLEDVVVYSVVNETFNTGLHGTWISLNYDQIVSGSETVTNISDALIFTKSGNYTMDYPGGRIATI